MLLNVHVIPHGDELIELPDNDSRRLNSAIVNISRLESADTIVVLSPHGMRLDQFGTIAMTQYVGGNLKLRGHYIKRKYPNDRELAESISAMSGDLFKKSFFITSSGEASVFPLDFGTLIPISFFRPKHLIVIGQPRIDNRNKLVEGGRGLFKAIDSISRNVSVIFSCDQAHTHSDAGPYGFSPEAENYDRLAREFLGSGKSEIIENIREKCVLDAKPDSYWNLLILDGLLKESGRRLRFLDYYVAKYFGMMVATSLQA